MAKKREWKAWMVVSKKSGVPLSDIFGRVSSVYRTQKLAQLGLDPEDYRIIRVRIVEA